MKVLNIAPIREEELKKIKKTCSMFEFINMRSQDVTQEIIDNVDIVVGNPNINLNLKHLKAILLCSAGSDQYIENDILDSHTILTNASGTYGKAIAEHIIGMMLTINKNFMGYMKNQNNHQWQMIQGGKEIYHSTVLIVGLGDLGYETAKRLKAFDCYIIGVKRRHCESLKYVDEIVTTDYINEVLPQADFVILTLPQNQSTYHLMNAERLRLMKKDSVLINVGRGSAIDTISLKKVLDEGYFYGVGLDVVEDEPLDENDTLWDYDRVFMTPHVSGGYEWESCREYFVELTIRNLQHLYHHEQLENIVDKDTGYRKNVILK
ncbi:MAG: D-2-hydroxyacid dehydrogenase [Erysipelotrichaceae bacterium]|nr:D-2-hydroxyacid dehydrogenase [Erysipelotrichaceae bacterium]